MACRAPWPTAGRLGPLSVRSSGAYEARLHFSTQGCVEKGRGRREPRGPLWPALLRPRAPQPLVKAELPGHQPEPLIIIGRQVPEGLGRRYRRAYAVRRFSGQPVKGLGRLSDAALSCRRDQCTCRSPRLVRPLRQRPREQAIKPLRRLLPAFPHCSQRRWQVSSWLPLYGR